MTTGAAAAVLTVKTAAAVAGCSRNYQAQIEGRPGPLIPAGHACSSEAAGGGDAHGIQPSSERPCSSGRPSIRLAHCTA